MNEYMNRLKSSDFFFGFCGSDVFFRRLTLFFPEESREERLADEFDFRSAFSFAFLLARLFWAGVFRFDGISIVRKVDDSGLCHL